MRWAARPAAFLVRLLGWTWRLRHHGVPAEKTESGFVDAFFHGDMISFIWVYRRSPSVTIVSEHRDGQIIAELDASVGRKRKDRG